MMGLHAMHVELAPSTSNYSDRASLLKDREAHLKVLVPQDVSLLRALIFDAYIAMMCISAYFAPKLVATGQALPVVSAVVILGVGCGVPGVALKRMRAENRRRWETIQGWAMLAHTEEGRGLPAGDMTPALALPHDFRVGNVVPQPGVATEATDVPMQYGSGLNPRARTIFSGVLFLLGAIFSLLTITASIYGISTQQEIAQPIGFAGAGVIFTLAMRAVFRRIPHHAKWCTEQNLNLRETQPAS